MLCSEECLALQAGLRYKLTFQHERAGCQHSQDQEGCQPTTLAAGSILHHLDSAFSISRMVVAGT